MTEQEEQELREQAKNGREAQAALNFLDKFLTQERAVAILDVETSENYTYENMLVPKIYLKVLRHFENSAKSFIELGEIAEKELREDGK